MRFEPKSVVVVDLNEYGLAELVRDVRSTEGLYVRDEFRCYTLNFADPIFERIFREEKGFDIVANFSAHKHVRSEKDKYSVQALIENNDIKAKKLMDLLTAYDPFLDFIKVYAILAVLLGHTFPFLDETGYNLWYGMQVPLFILVQVFHVMKKTNYKLNVRKMLQRILLPFLIIQMIPLSYVLYHTFNGNNLIFSYIFGGGYGPGAYFPWLYLQLAIILPIIKPLIEKGSKVRNLTIALILCIALEILTSLSGCPDRAYRLLPIRYFFLIFLGWLWVKEGIVINTKSIILSLLSMGSIIYFEYFYTPTEPWFYNTSWRCHRWPCYFYVSHLLCGLLYYLYIRVKKMILIQRVVKLLARCSYEIFLIQMVLIPFMPPMNFIQNGFLRLGLWMSTVFMVSILGGYYFNTLYGKYIKTT